MTQILNFAKDAQGSCAYAPKFPADNQSITLAVGAAQSFTVPSNFSQWTVAFSYPAGAVVWVSVGHTATPPAGGTFAATNSVLLPAQLTCLAGDVISVYNNGTVSVDMGVSMYANA